MTSKSGGPVTYRQLAARCEAFRQSLESILCAADSNDPDAYYVEIPREEIEAARSVLAKYPAQSG